MHVRRFFSQFRTPNKTSVAAHAGFVRGSYLHHALPAAVRRHLTNELRTMRLAISRRIDRALTFSALLIWVQGGWLCQSALRRINHEHSADAGSLPAVAGVVTRKLGPSRDSVATTMLSVQSARDDSG